MIQQTYLLVHIFLNFQIPQRDHRCHPKNIAIIAVYRFFMLSIVFVKFGKIKFIHFNIERPRLAYIENYPIWPFVIY